MIHAAGPFQRRTECNVLEACIAAGVPYMDVCDDADYSQRAKGLHQKCAVASQHSHPEHCDGPAAAAGEPACCGVGAVTDSCGADAGEEQGARRRQLA